VFLAGAVDARLALDLSLVADDAVLTAWVRAADPGGVAWAPGGDPGWVLERSAYALLAERLDADELSVELRAVLTEHAGEAARFPGAIAAMLQKCRSRDQLLAALVAENREALDAADPASRVRAFDWLVARKLAPPGFDPLAARAARRAALAAAQAASAAAAAPAPAAANAGAAAGSEVGR
jgi:hypothetical protein